MSFTTTTQLAPDFQLVITNFCKEDAFKRYVKDAINTELFWRDILQGNFGNNIDTKIDNKVSNFKNKIENSVRDIIDKKIESYTIKELPTNVANEVEKQVGRQLPNSLTNYLNNNSDMKRILELQITNLTTVLYNSAKETLDRLTNEPQYHEITNSHMNNIIKRCNDSADFQLLQNTNNFNAQLSHQTNIFNGTMTTIIDNSNKSLDKFEAFNRKADIMEKRIADLERDVYGLKHGLNVRDIFVGFGLMCAGVYMYVNK